MSSLTISGTVSTDWLADNLKAAGLRVVDVTWYMAGAAKTGLDDYRAGHIPGAVFWDLNAIADTQAPLPVTIPSADEFAAHMTRLGIGADSAVVVYDGTGIMSAARVWWMLRYFGHDNVAVLDGGMPKWKAESRPLEEGEAPAPQAEPFAATPVPALIADFDRMRGHVNAGDAQILDARGASRFRGEDEETRPNTRAGHMPGSLNLPYGGLLGADKTMADKATLKSRFADAGLDPSGSVAVTCGSGVSAPVLALGLFLTGNENVAVYDGSWNEWGAHPGAPVEKG